MDELDRKIYDILAHNARATVKEISKLVSLTSPAVSQRIRRMEAEGTIGGYTVRPGPALWQGSIGAIISIYVQPRHHDDFVAMLQREQAVVECYHVTGSQSHMLKVRCRDIDALNTLIERIQTLGQTNTQIILSTIFGPD